MNTLEQQTFIDRLNSAEGALGELAIYADNLANRLVGYADETQEGYGDTMPSMGFLPGVGDTASRMSRKVDEIRRCLSRINQALPAETINKPAGPSTKAAW
jgi:hypothetical protein